MCDSHAWSRYTRIYPDRMVSVGSVAVKAKVIALYAVVLSNANHRRQNVRRGEANRRLRPDDAALKPDPPLVALSARLTASVYIYIYIPIAKFLLAKLPFQFRRDEGEIFPSATNMVTNMVKNRLKARFTSQ